VEDNSWKVRRAAVEKLTDQAALAKIALEDKSGSVRRTAVKKLTDQDLLAKVALEAWYRDVRIAAVKKLADQAALGKVAADDEDWRVRLIFKVIRAYDSVPTEYRERLIRERLIADVLPAIRILSDPVVVSVIGDIVTVKTYWESTNASYTGGTKHGEEFTCSIKVRNLPTSLSHTWSTYYPYITDSLGFESADVNAGDLLGPAFDRLSQAALAKIAQEDKDEDVRKAAVWELTDQSLLAKVAVEAGDRNVRRAAVWKLTDQAALAKIAQEDEGGDVRQAAVDKLIDQELLAKIAQEDEDGDVRQAAVDKLIDQGLLAKIAREDKNEDVRQAAKNRLVVLRVGGK
jgi:hypothetical protein